MRKILFPVDYAEHSPKVLNYALKIAKTFDALLIPMHVYNVPEDAFYTKREEEDLGTAMLHTLKEYIQNNRDNRYEDVTLEYLVDVGLPEDTIVDVALDIDIDLIIMGMTGIGKNRALMFGRTSLSVISKADCPVLAVPATFEFQLFKNITYLTDFHFRDIGALNILKQWADQLTVNIHCLHILNPSENKLDAEVNMKMLEDCYVSKQFATFEVLEGDLIEAVNRYTTTHSVGILATLSQKRGFLQRIIAGSQTRKLAEQINVPILVFKENAYKPILYPIDFRGISIA